MQLMHCLQNQVVGGHVLRAYPERALEFVLTQMRSNRFDGFDGDDILQAEDVIEVAVTTLCLHDFSRAAVSKLGVEPHPAVDPLRASVQDIAHAQVAADRTNVDVEAAQG